MKFQFTVFIILIISLNFSIRLTAQTDFIDSSFAINGSYILDYEGLGTFDQGGKSLVQADQKIIVGGTVRNGPFNYDIYLMRLNTDGTLDPTFGNNGELLIDFNDEDYFADMIFTTNEDIIISANIGTPGFGQTLICKANNNGTLDNSFGTSNAHSLLNSTTITHGGGLSLQSNGKIITVNEIGVLGGTDFQITRFNTDGTLDNSFGNNGMIIEDYGSNYISPSSFFIDHNDFVLIGGTKDNSVPFLTRYRDNGVFDTTFADNGHFTFPANYYYSIGTIGLDNANKHYIVNLFEYTNLDNDFELMQLQITGELDSTFGNNGFLILDFGGDDRLSEFQYDVINTNNLILSGRSNDTSSYYQLFTSIDAIGMIDTTFGDNGIVKVNFEQSEYIGNIALQGDGKILLTGSRHIPNSSNNDIFVGRIFRDLLSNTISNIEPVPNLSIFPNPTVNYFQIKLDDRVNQNAMISIFDLNGNEVFSKNINIQSGEAEILLPQSILNGQYVLKIKSDDFSVAKMIMVIR